jgi:hypothetical protein
MPYKDREQRLACKRRSHAMHREQERTYRRAYKARPEVVMHEAFIEAPLTARRVSGLEKRFGITLDARFVAMLQAMREYRRFLNPRPLIECACGCGRRFTDRNERGTRRRFVVGHNVSLASHPRTPRGPSRQPNRQSLSPEERVARARKAAAARWRKRALDTKHANSKTAAGNPAGDPNHVKALSSTEGIFGGGPVSGEQR